MGSDKNPSVSSLLLKVFCSGFYLITYIYFILLIKFPIQFPQANSIILKKGPDPKTSLPFSIHRCCLMCWVPPALCFLILQCRSFDTASVHWQYIWCLRCPHYIRLSYDSSSISDHCYWKYLCGSKIYFMLVLPPTSFDRFSLPHTTSEVQHKLQVQTSWRKLLCASQGMCLMHAAPHPLRMRAKVLCIIKLTLQNCKHIHPCSTNSIFGIRESGSAGFGCLFAYSSSENGELCGALFVVFFQCLSCPILRSIRRAGLLLTRWPWGLCPAWSPKTSFLECP